MRNQSIHVLATIGIAALALPGSVTAIVFDDPVNYQIKNTWSAPNELGVPENLGGLMFSQDGTILYAVGSSEEPGSAVWAIPVTRDPTTNVVTALGPSSTVTKVFDGTPGVSGGIAAGLELGPEGTLFYTYWDANVIAQRPGGVGGAETLYPLDSLGVSSASTGLDFSPHVQDPSSAFGRLQLSANSPTLYNIPLTQIGVGQYSVGFASEFVTVSRDDIGAIQFVRSGPFAGDLMYVSWGAGEVVIVDIDPATGSPIDAGTSQPTLGTSNPVETRFASDLGNGPWGLEFDPITNEMFLGTWQGNPPNSIMQIGGDGFPPTGSPTTTTTLPPLPSGCADGPLPGCRRPTQAGKAALMLKSGSVPKKNKLAWKWKKGDATALGDFGDPTSVTDYALCLYDESSATPALLMVSRAPFGGTCKKEKPCWKAKGSKGFAYKDKERTPDGLMTVKLKAGDAGRAKILVNGKGENLVLPSLPAPMPLRVQLQSESGTCWDATYSASKKNTETQFKATSD